MDADDLPLSLNQSTALHTGLLPEFIPSTARLQGWRRQMSSDAWARPLDRVNVLGSDDHGHTGCVNALSWSQNGELLISSGDDQQLRVWRMDPNSSGVQNEYPFACQTVIETGHSANVFNAQMLPSSTRIATVAGDKQVRVFDVGESVGRSSSGSQVSYSTKQACIRILRCHSRRTKRIITEDSPDFFLTVAEDGEVRQHDLRTPHSCGRGACPAPLVQLPHELSTIALSPLTPYQFVVGGESPFAHLFDRRHVGRNLQEEWGVSPTTDNVTTCVRRFSRLSRAPGETKGYEHITGARMSACNGHELLLSFNSDAVYLYSTREEPGTSRIDGESSILPSNSHRGTRDLNFVSLPSKARKNNSRALENPEEAEIEVDNSDSASDDDNDNDNDNDDMLVDESETDGDGESASATDMHPDASVIYPRMRFSGHCNIETVKDVNFLGPYDEYVTSGSDDGNFFIWKKSTGELVDILEGDGSVVNVIEGHPALPLISVSGIDTTIKLFAPARGEAKYSKYQNASSIMRRNARASRRGTTRSANIQFARLLIHHQDHALDILRGVEDGGTGDTEARLVPCISQ